MRAIHIHFKIRTFSGNREAYEFTSQLFFDDATTLQVVNEAPYRQHGSPDTTNGSDGIYRSGGNAGATVKKKELVVTGNNFATGAVILMDGQTLETRNRATNPTAVLVAKGIAIARGATVTIQVQNPDGELSNEFAYTRADSRG